MIDPVMLFCVSGVALTVALLVVFGSWVEQVAEVEKVEIMRTMLAIQEQPASESAVWVEPPYEKGEL